jgi:apolipoprotein N-acyltransferase
MVVGHPLVATPFCVVFGTIAVLGIAHDGFNWPIAIILTLVGAVANAARQAGRYRIWKREWDGFDPNHQPSRPIRNAVQWLVALLMVAALLWLAGSYRDDSSPAHIIAPLLVIGLAALGLLKFVLRLCKRRRPSSSNQVVTQAISRPLSAPTVADAYARLPDYLRPLFHPQHEKEDQQ